MPRRIASRRVITWLCGLASDNVVAALVILVETTAEEKEEEEIDLDFEWSYFRLVGFSNARNKSRNEFQTTFA